MPHFSLVCVLASTALVGCLVHGEHFGDPPALPPGDATNALQVNVSVTRVVDGLALVYIYADQPFDRESEYSALERQAMAAGIGVWSD
jgi:endonuclease YncB( thermonuclease family)